MTYTKTEILNKAQNAIAGAYEQVIGSYIGQTRATIEAFRLSATSMSALYSIFRTEDLATITENIFKAQANRDFVLNLSINFHVRFAEGDAEYATLVDILTDSFSQYPHAYTVAKKREAPSLIPKPYLERLPDTESIRSALLGNKWLVSYVMLILFTPVSQKSQQTSS